MKKTLSFLLVLSMIFSAMGMTAGAEGTEEKQIIGDGFFEETTIGEAIAEPGVLHPVNPYSEEALQLPPEVIASSADLQISTADSARTGEGFEITVIPADDAGFVDYRLQIYELNTWDDEETAYYTVYLRHSDTPVFEYVFYDTGTFRIDVTGTREDQSGAIVSTDVYVTQGASGTTVAEKVQTIVAECSSAANTEYDRALWLHDWLTANANYDYDYSIYGADGVLMRGTGVCDSYSKAYQLLLRAMNIETMREIGQAGGGNHAWNLVKIEENWCQVDCTWDDPGSGGSENHDYFGITDTMMARDHSWSGSYPNCDSLANCYFVRLGFTPVASAEELDEILSSAATAQQANVKLCYIGPKANYSIRNAFTKWFYANNWKYGLLSFTSGTEPGDYTIEYGEPWDQPAIPTAVDFRMQGLYGWHTLEQYSGNNGLVLVFGGNECPNTMAYLSGMQENLSELQAAGVDVLVSLEGCTTVDSLRLMEESLPGYRYTYSDTDLLWQYLWLFGVTSSVYYPCVFYVNDAGEVVDYTTGYVSDMEEALSLAESLGTGNPIPEPLRHLDYSDYEAGCGSIAGLTGETIISAAQQAAQSGWVYLYINYQNSSDSPLAQFEEGWQIYNKLGISMIASFADGADLSAQYPNVRFASFSNHDFWSMLSAAGFDTSGNMSYLCGYLISPEGTILAAQCGSSPELNDFAGYVAGTLQYASTVPAGLTEIGAEAFAEDAFISVNLDNESLQRIGAGAFSNCDSLSFVCIPDSVAEIAEGVFQNCDDLLIVCTIGSEADRYAQNNGIPYVYN